MAVTAVATALAVAAGRGAAGSIAVAAAVLAGQLSVGWSNDAVDAWRDRTSGRVDKPVASGAISARVVWLAAVVAAAACVPLSLLSGLLAATVHLIAVAFAWAYNVRAKATIASVVPYGVAFALLPAFVTLGLPGHPWPAAWAVAAGGCLGAGAHLANALPDLHDDVAVGVRGLPHRLGAGRSRVAASVFLVIAAALIALVPGGRLVPALIVLAGSAAVTTVGLLRGARRPGSRAAFRAVLLAAGLDVALLVLRAGHLH